MTIRMFTVLFTVVMLGCSSNPSLDSLKANVFGAMVGINIAQFGDVPAPKAISTFDKSTVNSEIGKYDFSVEEVHFRESTFLSNGSQAPSIKIIAKNRGYAPVSVTI